MTLTLLGHINNLYNTTFWALIQLGGMDGTEAEKTLKVNFLAPMNKTMSLMLRKGTYAADKKGSVVFRDASPLLCQTVASERLTQERSTSWWNLAHTMPPSKRTIWQSQSKSPRHRPKTTGNVAQRHVLWWNILTLSRTSSGT